MADIIVCGTAFPSTANWCTYYHLDGSCTAYTVAQESTYIEPDFELQEFAPTTSLNPNGINERWETYQKLADQLQSARSAMGVPIVITSGYRTEGQVDVHHYGLAVDTNVSGKTFVEVTQAYYNAGFRRIEVMKPSGTSYNDDMSVGGHIHVDIYDPNNSLYSAGGALQTTAQAPPWYAYGIEGGNPVTVATFSDLMSYLESH